LRLGPPAILVAVAVLAWTAPAVLGQFHLPRLLPSKAPAPPSVEAEAEAGAPSQPKAAPWRSLKLPKLDPSQHKLGTEVAGGAFGGAVAGGAFGSFAGPAGTMVGAIGGALAGGTGAAAASTFKDHARRRWGWR
jgi:hypothetical protein